MPGLDLVPILLHVSCVKSLQSCLTLCLWTVAHQDSLSMGSTRQEYWSFHSLLQGIFQTQGLNQHLLRLLHWQVGSLRLEPPGKSLIGAVSLENWLLEWGSEILLLAKFEMRNKPHTCSLSWYPILSMVLLPLPSMSDLRGVGCWDCSEDHIKNKISSFISQCIPFPIHRREQENQDKKSVIYPSCYLWQVLDFGNQNITTYVCLCLVWCLSYDLTSLENESQVIVWTVEDWEDKWRENAR